MIGFFSFFDELAGSFRLVDLLDIGLVAALLFAVIVTLQGSTSPAARRRAALLFVTTLSVYLLARFLDLYLLEQIVQVVVVVGLVAMVVIFQSDLRRLLDRVSRLAGTTRSSGSELGVTDVLIASLSHLAEARTGALVAIRGRDSWTDVVRGGVELDGCISEPLLYSIFDERTDGHDGALLLEGDRVARFAAHLPLAEEMPSVSRFGGTRHAAALGLAEETDAFVLVVSEETGTISIAHRGELQAVEEEGQLRERLEEFWSYHYTSDGESARWWTRHNVRAALLSIGMATLLWLLFAYSPNTIYRTYDLPIEYRDVPDAWMLSEEAAPSVQVVLTGAQQAFRQLNPAEMAVTLDVEQGLARARSMAADTVQSPLGVRFNVREEDMLLPSGLTLDRVQPRTIEVQLSRAVRVLLPVEAIGEGTLGDSLQLIEMTTRPDSLPLFMPAERGDEDLAVTVPVDLGAIRSTTTVEREVELPPGARAVADEEATVEVRVVVRRVTGSAE